MNSWITIRPPVDQCLIIPLISSSKDMTISEEFILPSEPTKNNLNLHIIFSHSGFEQEPFPHSSLIIIQTWQRVVKSKMNYLIIFLLILANTSISGCFTSEANTSAKLLLEKISNQETSANSELTFTIHTNFFITTLLHNF